MRTSVRGSRAVPSLPRTASGKDRRHSRTGVPCCHCANCAHICLHERDRVSASSPIVGLGGAMTEATKPQDVTFHYIKSSQFRVVHADGIIGGVTPRGLIHIAVFSERPAIPQVIV